MDQRIFQRTVGSNFLPPKKTENICSIFKLKVRTLKMTFSVGYLRPSRSIAFCDVRLSNVIAIEVSEEPAVSTSVL